MSEPTGRHAAAFKYGRSIRRGYTWYCQTPGTRWATDPIIGWELYYTDGPSWWLIGPDGSETDMCTRKVKEAMVRAFDYVYGKKAGD